MSAGPVILEVPLQSELGQLGLALRRRVFCDEQHVPLEIERDQYDAAATHVVALVEGNVAGVLRIVFLPEHAKFGRVAVDATYRRRGVARTMMEFAMELARTRGERRFYLISQLDKAGLYEGLGFKAFGAPVEEGGLPHLAMKSY